MCLECGTRLQECRTSNPSVPGGEGADLGAVGASSLGSLGLEQEGCTHVNIFCLCHEKENIEITAEIMLRPFKRMI